MNRSPLPGTIVLMGLLLLSTIGCSPSNPRVQAALNTEASLTGPLPFNPLQETVITSWIDNHAATMSTLYGNDVAARHARTSLEHDYPPGARLSAVTWTQKEDLRWFGGNIPDHPESVEFVVVTQGADHGALYRYERYEGKPLRKTVDQQGFAPAVRATWILSTRAAVMP